MIRINFYIFRYWSAIFRDSIKTREHNYNTPIHVLVFFCFNRLPEDDTPVPKHVGIVTYRIALYDLYCTVFYCVHFLVNMLNGNKRSISLYRMWGISLDVFRQ